MRLTVTAAKQKLLIRKENFMKIRIKPKEIFSVPNLISCLRLALIPVIIWAYCEEESGLLTAVFVLLSGFTDVLDGKIARRFNMVTDIGKVLDPVADKLTQAAMMYCLLTKYELMLYAFIILIVKEIFMAVTAVAETMYVKQINSALWYGKVCTAIIYASVIILLFIPKIPLWAANLLIAASIGAMVISTAQYGVHRFKSIRKAKSEI